MKSRLKSKHAFLKKKRRGQRFERMFTFVQHVRLSLVKS